MLYIRWKNGFEPSALQTAAWRFHKTTLYRFPFPPSLYISLYTKSIFMVYLYTRMYYVTICVSLSHSIVYVHLVYFDQQCTRKISSIYCYSVENAKRPLVCDVLCVYACIVCRVQQKSGYIVQKFCVWIYIYMSVSKGICRHTNGMIIGGLDTMRSIPHRAMDPAIAFFRHPPWVGAAVFAVWVTGYKERGTAYSIPCTAINPCSNPICIYLKYEVWAHSRWSYILLFLAFRFEVYVFSLRSILILIYSFNLTLI